jgi:hypothetical protein
VWSERVEYQWDLRRLSGLRTRYGAAKRRLEALDPIKRVAFLERVTARLSGLSPRDFLYRGAAVCAVAAINA